MDKTGMGDEEDRWALEHVKATGEEPYYTLKSFVCKLEAKAQEKSCE